MIKPPSTSIHPKTRAEWHTWLKQNHTRAEGVWPSSCQKGPGKPRFEYEEAVEEALRFGWIDGKPNRLDGEGSMLWFAPRKAGTGWSRISNAGKPETRAKRAEETARFAAENIRANQRRP